MKVVRLAVALFGLVTCGGRALAVEPPAPSSAPAVWSTISVAAPDTGWNCSAEHEAWRAADARLVSAAMQQGLKGAADHLAELRIALAHTPAAPVALIEVCGDKTLVHTANPLVMAVIASGVKSQTVTAAGKPVPPTLEARPMPYVEASLLVGSANVEAKRYADAVAALRQGLAFAPGQPTLTSEAARALEQLGRNEEAIALCDTALARTGAPPIDAARVHRAKGYALGELGRYAEAIGEYEASQRLDPNEIVAANELTYLRGRQAGRDGSVTTQTTGDQTRIPDVKPFVAEPTHPKP